MNENLVQSKNHLIGFPLKITLTEEGIRFFMHHNKKLNKIRTADGQIEYGCILENISIEYIKRMIKFNYISKIEIETVRLNAKRKEITDITDSILNELLILKLNEDIYKNIINTAFIKNWNRINPSKCIDEKTKFNSVYIEEIISKNFDVISDIKYAIMNSCMFEIKKDPLLSLKEINNNLKLINKFIDSIKNNVWHLIIKMQSTDDYYSVVSFINKTIYEYIEKSKTSDYFSLILLELLTNSENTKILKFIKKFYRNRDEKELLNNGKLREIILSKMEERKENVYLIWKIKNKLNSMGSDYKLKFMILNKEYDYKLLKEEIETRKRISVNEKTLFNLYNESKDELSSENLGLAYLSYFDEACKKLNIKFESFVNQIISDDLPLITLSLNYK
jgi:hypothetical protein